MIERQRRIRNLIRRERRASRQKADLLANEKKTHRFIKVQIAIRFWRNYCMRNPSANDTLRDIFLKNPPP
jgi:hypothetical protein